MLCEGQAGRGPLIHADVFLESADQLQTGVILKSFRLFRGLTKILQLETSRLPQIQI